MFGNVREMLRNYRERGSSQDGDAQCGDSEYRDSQYGAAEYGDAKYGDVHFRRFGSEEQRELIRRAQSGDTAARDQLIASYVPAVASAVDARCVRGPDEFDDCAQEVMLRLMRAVACYDSSRRVAVSSYFFRVIYRAIGRFNRKGASRRKRTIRLWDSAVPGVLDAVDDETLLARSAKPGETEAFAAELLDRANPREKQVLASFFRGETLTAIGKRMGVTKERVRQIKETGLERIRRSVEGDRRQSGPERGRR